MRSPLIQRRRGNTDPRSRERGVTMALVAASIAVVIAMAALSIDVGTLYEASAEAQRSADAAALAAARVLSISGMTGDPNNTSLLWANACNAALQAAQSVAGQNFVGGAAPTVNVSWVPADGCTSSGGVFGVNPMVTVKVANTSLPTFFAHIFGLFNSNWTTAGVSATATAEVYNPSNSAAYAAGSAMVPVQPRCVKPWIVPNRDPGNAVGCTSGCLKFVSINAATEGQITNTNGIIVGGAGTGVIGETFNLKADCNSAGTSPCNSPPFVPPSVSPAGYLQYIPSQVLGTPVAAPSCAANQYQQAIAGCDQSTPYQCGIPVASTTSRVDFNENPIGSAGDTAEAAQCLINPTAKGADTLNTAVYPYQIVAGAGNPTGASGNITSSNSIVSFPIYDDTNTLAAGANPQVAIVGFLQVFINAVNPDGSLNVTVLNVAGCGEAATVSPVTGTSPVPVRLITPQ
jgi:Flp pilus assembly protein TadG